MPKLVIVYISKMCGGKGSAVRISQKLRPGSPSFTYSTPIRQFLHEVNREIAPGSHPRTKKTALERILKEIYLRDLRDSGARIAPDAMKRFYAQFRTLTLPLVENRANVQDISTFIRAEFGEDTFAKTMARIVAEVSEPIVIVDGARRHADIALLRTIPNVHLFFVYIDAPLERRHVWYVDRNQNEGDDKVTMETFKVLDDKEPEREIVSLRSIADLVITNDTTYSDFTEKVERLFADVCMQCGV